MDHYAESFCLLSNQCFRMIQAEDGTGHAQHCPYLIEWRGRFKDAAGRWHTVESCQGHRADLDSVQRIGESTSTAPPGGVMASEFNPSADDYSPNTLRATPGTTTPRPLVAKPQGTTPDFGVDRRQFIGHNVDHGG